MFCVNKDDFFERKKNTHTHKHTERKKKMGQTLLFILNFEFGFFFLVIVSAMRKYVKGRKGGWVMFLSG